MLEPTYLALSSIFQVTLAKFFTSLCLIFIILSEDNFNSFYCID